MDRSASKKFDPEDHKNNVYEAFVEFVDEFKYEYDAIAKDPPKDLENDAARTAWVKQNKRKIFLGKFLATCKRILKKQFLKHSMRPSRMTK